MNNKEMRPYEDTPFKPSARTPIERLRLRQKIPELLWTERLIRKYQPGLGARLEATIIRDDLKLPIYSLTLGNTSDNTVPSLLITGGVHGVERIGIHIILSWLNSLLERLIWDQGLQQQLTQIQIIVVPIVNPMGVYLNSRANGRGVDLNRNAPVAAEGEAKILLAGHRLSKLLPWFRGNSGDCMEEENKTLERIIHQHIFTHKTALILDIHSGFGMRDRIWFPFAFRKKLIDTIDRYVALKTLWENCYPSHNYVFEPQALHYLSHGDIWDYFYLQSAAHNMKVFMPLTLELGSWSWVKKRPLQLFNFAGLFNPQKPHRRSRALRRHIVLLEFLIAATINNSSWVPQGEKIEILKRRAERWWGS